jgi:GH25 family lysozyme M1 (1,4-beta-N-acetylmuramidase)
MITFTPRVIDISHHNSIGNLKDTADAGIWGVIHKASQGVSYRDPDYSRRRDQAISAGLLWGAYHFCDGSSIELQVANFIAAAAPDERTLVALDFEDYPRSNMSIANLVRMLRLVESRLGRRAIVYGGNRIKDHIHELSAIDRAYLFQHDLWLCQYGAAYTLPIGFTSYFLWQFTDGQHGPLPHGVPGVLGLVDLNRFDGTQEELTARWVSATQPQRADDDVSRRAQQAGTDEETPPSSYRLDTEILQSKLKSLGYFEVGNVDGKWGGKTRAAIAAFLNDRHVDSPPVPGDALNSALSDAISNGWSRPIADERANASPKELAKVNDAVKMSLRGQLLGKVTAGATALGITGSTISGIYASARDTLNPVHDALTWIPPEGWLALTGGVALLVWYASKKSSEATAKDYNTGRLN